MHSRWEWYGIYKMPLFKDEDLIGKFEVYLSSAENPERNQSINRKYEMENME